jgi:hypothetical protein
LPVTELLSSCHGNGTKNCQRDLSSNHTTQPPKGFVTALTIISGSVQRDNAQSLQLELVVRRSKTARRATFLHV